MPAITQETIGAEGDDGQEVDDTTWNTGTGAHHIRAGHDTGPSVSWNAGWRWTSVPIPSGATINTATITLDVYGQSGSPAFLLWGDARVDQGAFSASDRPSQVTKTTDSVAVSSPGTGTEVMDVASQLQQIVDLAAWTSATTPGHDVRWALLNTVTTGYNFIRWEDYQAGYNPPTGLEIPPLLDANFTAGAGGEEFLGRQYPQGVMRGVMRGAA